MKELKSIIYNLPITKITKVYLIGSENNYYKVFLTNNSEQAVKIDLKEDLKYNFIPVNKDGIFIGHKTKIVNPKIAFKFLTDCKYLDIVLPANTQTFNTLLKLVEIQDFRKYITDFKEKLTFYFWLRLQLNRDDLIGDIARDVTEDSGVKVWYSFDDIKKRIDRKTSSNWDINSFQRTKKKGSVNPLVCLKLAKMEFDVEAKKKMLSKFAIRNNSGFVYFLKPDNSQSPIKVGRAKNIENRILQLQTSLPYNLEIIGYIKTENNIDLERQIHNQLINQNIKREWYDITIDKVKNIIKNNNGFINSKFDK